MGAMPMYPAERLAASELLELPARAAEAFAINT
jgi:hypothetical protein